METPIDPIRVPTITLSQAEIEEIEAEMAAGQLPPDFLDRHYAAVDANVFGHDHKKDKHGNPIEQGFGAPGNQTRNSINAFKRYAKYDADYSEATFKETLQRMEAELAASDKLRAEVRAAAGAARRTQGARR